MTDIDRRAFLAGLSVASGLTIVPRRVLGGPGYIAPSDMVVLAQVGCGTQAQRQINTGVARRPDVQFVAVVDPNRDSQNYVDWSEWGNRNQIRRFLEEPQWGASDKGIRGGREVAKEIMETYYRKQNRAGGIRAYEDYREMLEKERDIQGVVNITPDHQHGSINIAALRKGKAAISHKPVASVLYEVRRTLQAARDSSAVSHLLAYSNNPDRHTLAAWINAGVDRHGARSAQLDEPAVLAAGHAGVSSGGTAGTGWLQLGAVAGAGAGASLSSELHVRRLSRLVRLRSRLPRRHGALQPVAAVPHPQSRHTGVGRRPPEQRRLGQREERQHRRPRLARSACRARASSAGDIRRLPTRPAVDTFWYDGGMKPQTPDELYADNEDLADEGMLIVGDKGKILCDFRGNAPRLIPRSRQQAFAGSIAVPEFDSDQSRRRVGERHQVGEEVARQLRTGRAARRSGDARQHRAPRALQAAAVGRGEAWSSPTPPRRTSSCAARRTRTGWDTLIG